MDISSIFTSFRSRLVASLGLGLIFAGAGCATATPVTPSAISVEDAPKLQATLVGTWAVTGTQKPGGPVKEASLLTITFTPDGVMAYNVAGSYHYRLEGRNIVSDSMYRTIRVDEWTDKVLKLFLFDTSEIWICTKA